MSQTAMMPEPGTPRSQPEPEGLSVAVLELVKHIRGFEELECLLFLFQRRGQEWLPKRLAQDLRFKESDLSDALERLVSAGHLEQSGKSFRYPAASKQSDHSVRSLLEIYQADRLRVIKVLTDLSLERMRSSTIQTFSESFRFKRRPNA